MASLRALDLSYNGIQVLPSSFSSTLNRVPHVNLTGNPWHCNCEMSWVRASITTNNRFDINACETPQNMDLFRMRPVDFQCTIPDITSITGNITVAIGASFFFKCNAAADPAPEVRLQNPMGEEMRFHPSPDRSRTITFAMWKISGAKTSHSGDYICNATNRLGATIRTIYINVVDPTLITTPVIPTTTTTTTTTTTSTQDVERFITMNLQPTTINSLRTKSTDQQNINYVNALGTSNPVFPTENPSYFIGLTLIMLIVGSVLVFIMIVITVCCCLAKKHKTKKEYTPVKSQQYRDLELPDRPPPIHV